MFVLRFKFIIIESNRLKLEQLECLRSEIPPPPHDYPYALLVIHIRSQVKSKQSQSYKFKKKRPKIQILQQTLHATYLVKLIDKMCKYEMDPTKTVGATEWTQDAARTDGRTDGQTDRWMDGVKPIYPPTTSLCRGIIRTLSQTGTKALQESMLTKISHAVWHHQTSVSWAIVYKIMFRTLRWLFVFCITPQSYPIGCWFHSSQLN